MTVDPEFEALYRAEFGAVRRAAYLLCGDRALAEDAAQEAFARALARWPRLREQSWVTGWIVTTALNVARRSLRRRPQAGPERPAQGDPDAAADLWTGIRALSPRQQEAIALYYVADLPLSEVAHLMRCEVGTVKSHLARARETLARRLEVAQDDP